MAEHGTGAATAGESPAEAAFEKDRQAMFGGFTTFTTYAVAGIAGLLILMAIFLV
jgi:hypothetical protein